MTKRKRFIVTSIVLSLGFIAMQAVADQFKIVGIVGLSFLTIPFLIWSLREGLGLNMTLMVLILPFLFTLGVGFFWFLIPVSVFARIPVVVLFGAGIYALCLTLNIYTVTVSAIRTIALLRAARGVGFVLTLLTFFLLFDTVLSLRWWVYLTAGIVLLVSVPMYLQGYWSFDLGHTLTKKLLIMSLVSSLVMAEVTALIFFWPVGVVVGSLFLTVTAYILLGLGQAEMEGRLFKQTVREYLIVGFSVLVGMFLATHWS